MRLKNAETAIFQGFGKDHKALALRVVFEFLYGWRNEKDKEVHERGMGVDFVDYLHDSANFKQAWFALAALAVLLIPLCASMGE